MKVLTIERSKWYRGKTGLHSYLLDSVRGDMCCLGFDAIARGLTEEDIDCHGDPASITDPPDHYVEVMFVNGDGLNLRPAVRAAIAHNDDDAIDETTRETRIREDLIELGWDDVVFVD